MKLFNAAGAVAPTAAPKAPPAILNPPNPNSAAANVPIACPNIGVNLLSISAISSTLFQESASNNLVKKSLLSFSQFSDNEL